MLQCILSGSGVDRARPGWGLEGVVGEEEGKRRGGHTKNIFAHFARNLGLSFTLSYQQDPNNVHFLPLDKRSLSPKRAYCKVTVPNCTIISLRLISKIPKTKRYNNYRFQSSQYFDTTLQLAREHRYVCACKHVQHVVGGDSSF